MSIVDTPEKYFPNVDRKYDMRKLLTYLVRALSTLFSCSMRAMYIRVNIAQKQHLIVK